MEIVWWPFISIFSLFLLSLWTETVEIAFTQADGFCERKRSNSLLLLFGLLRLMNEEIVYQSRACELLRSSDGACVVAIQSVFSLPSVTLMGRYLVEQQE